MPKVKLCFLWHMHQPLYKDLVKDEYKLPWTRLHALKDYYGMVKILDEFPAVRQTFNLVPSLAIQIDEYASGKASDPFLRLASKPAEDLSSNEKEFILKYFFQANEGRVIRRYPRYSELFSVMQNNEHNPRLAMSSFDASMVRDLQVLSQLAWFDESYLEDDAEMRELVEKGRNFSIEDQTLIGEKESELLSKVLGVYRKAAERGQIEISTSAYYHPILPLLCDSNIAGISHPYIPLPARFSYPEDAEEQLRRSCEYIESKFGTKVNGLWPSEGSVSDAALAAAARVGFKWTASDDGVLGRTLDRALEPTDAYQPYRWRQQNLEIDVVFRDRRLSNLIGFVYARMDPELAAQHFIEEVKQSCSTLLNTGSDAVVAIILDGENAWESYAKNGRPFLRALYTRISEEEDIAAVTMTAGMAGQPRVEIKSIFPGSWIETNFDVWIGGAEDNLAWEHLLAARRRFDEVMRSPHGATLSEEVKNTAREALMIAEGSDWCWWYGPQHFSVNKAEFDELFRAHLANVYRLLGDNVPAALMEPILLKASERGVHEEPRGLIQPRIDGLVSPRTEWADAGRYRIDPRSGAMHSQRSYLQDLYYGSDGQNIYVRIDPAEAFTETAPVEFRLRVRNPAHEQFELIASRDSTGLWQVTSDLPENAATAAIHEIYEARLSMSALHIRLGDPLFLQIEVFRGDLPVASIPTSGELELRSGTFAAYTF